MVEPVFAYDTALGFWSNPRIPNRAGNVSACHASRAMETLGRPIGHAELACLSKEPLFDFLPRPYHILVSCREARRRTRQADFKLWQSVLPDNALVSFTGCEYSTPKARYRPLISSPELCFVQMARYLSLVELVELGYELCGEYAISPCSPKGLLSRTRRTAPQLLSNMAESVTGPAGVHRARVAARLVLAGSRSPKESQVAMLATMPEKMGGYGIRPPALNRKIPLDGDAARVLRSESCVPDLYWPDAGLVLEYDSRDWHEQAEINEHDTRKRTVYTLLGIDVITITRGQLYDFSAFDSIMRSLRKRICGAAKTDAGYHERSKLHQAVLFGERRPRLLGPAHKRMFSGAQEAKTITVAKAMRNSA